MLDGELQGDWSKHQSPVMNRRTVLVKLLAITVFVASHNGVFSPPYTSGTFSEESTIPVGGSSRQNATNWSGSCGRRGQVTLDGHPRLSLFRTVQSCGAIGVEIHGSIRYGLILHDLKLESPFSRESFTMSLATFQSSDVCLSSYTRYVDVHVRTNNGPSFQFAGASTPHVFTLHRVAKQKDGRLDHYLRKCPRLADTTAL